MKRISQREKLRKRLVQFVGIVGTNTHTLQASNLYQIYNGRNESDASENDHSVPLPKNTISSVVWVSLQEVQECRQNPNVGR